MRSGARHARKELETQLWRVPVSEPKSTALESPVEDLGLSVRTRNALRGIGCDTVEDLLGLDLSSPVRGLGRKTKDELLTALERTGFRHPADKQEPGSEIRILERGLERIQCRVEAALGAVAKEIQLLRQRLRKVVPRRGD
jgi:DNA-directed RNA polymerase alpha subunit